MRAKHSGLVETSGEECHQVCRQLEPADTVKIITLAPVIAVFTQGNWNDINYINFRKKNTTNLSIVLYGQTHIFTTARGNEFGFLA